MREEETTRSTYEVTPVRVQEQVGVRDVQRRSEHLPLDQQVITERRMRFFGLNLVPA